MSLEQELDRIFSVESPSKAGVTRGVISRSLWTPTSSLPLFVAAGSGFMAMIFGMGGFWSSSLLYAGTLAGLSVGYNLAVRRPTHAKRAVEAMYRQQERAQKREMRDIQNRFLKKAGFGDLRDLGEQASRQVRLSVESLNAIRAALAARLTTTELTYQRYLGSAREVYSSILHNLDRAENTLTQLAAIDLKHIANRHAALRNRSNLDAADQEELTALEKRLATRQELRDRLSSLLSANETALTTFADTAAAMDRLETTRESLTTSTMEESMNDLKELASRVEALGKQAQAMPG